MLHESEIFVSVVAQRQTYIYLVALLLSELNLPLAVYLRRLFAQIFS